MSPQGRPLPTNAFRLQPLGPSTIRPAPFGTVLTLRCARLGPLGGDTATSTQLGPGRMLLLAPDELEREAPQPLAASDYALTVSNVDAREGFAIRDLMTRLGGLAGIVVPVPEAMMDLATPEGPTGGWYPFERGEEAVRALLDIQHSFTLLPGRGVRVQANLLLRLHAARTYLESNLGEARTCTDAANVANLSRAHFSRLFRGLFRCTPKALRQECRDALALELLESTALSTSEIARRCGFSDRTAFHRSFRERLGTTPGEWRERQRRARKRLPVRSRIPTARHRDDVEGERFPGFA